MALMAAHGLIGRVDCAIFADTQWEPAATYEHLAWLCSPNVLPFPVHRVTAGNIRADALSRSNTTGQRFAAIPWFLKKIDHRGVWEQARGRRQCTSEYKIEPIRRKVVELLGGKRKRGSCEMLIGISTDEAARAKPSRVKYIVNAYPLLDADMSRQTCLRWLEKHDYAAPPKSACIGCPYRSNAEWRALPAAEFADAVEVDTAIRRQPGFRGEQFAHRQMKPLAECDLSTREERGQNNWINECEGMCGV